jgi:fucose permease
MGTGEKAAIPVINGAAPYGRSLALLATLFFMWGFITVINNTLLPHLRSVFELNYTQTTLIESVWFIAYGIASVPSAFLIERVGYKKAIVIGLIVMALGALGMVPAARLPSYEITLVALFVIACGIALLQVGRQSLCRGHRTTRKLRVPPHPGPGVQFDGDLLRSHISAAT